MRISPILAFDDNYIWLLQHNGSACVVDPGDAEPVLERLERDGLALTAILLTHKHADHTGGVRDLLERYPGIPVFGPSKENAFGVSHPLTEGAAVRLPGLGALMRVLEVPGHTEGHLAYLSQDALFCGDTLFSVGCGRVFSGTHQQLHHSLQRIAALPGDTLCYCAHEYTLDNIGFAKWVEPDNPALLQRERQVQSLRRADQPTVPSLLSQELACNPFLRVREPELIRAVEGYAGHGLDSPAAVFTALRGWKDKEYD